MCFLAGDSPDLLHGDLSMNALLLAVISSACVSAAGVKSPDGRLEINLAADGGRVFYRVDYDGKAILAPSRLGLVLKNALPLDQGLKIVGQTPSSRDSTWRPVCGERAEVRDHHNQLVVDLEDSSNPPRRLQITLRAYDEGAALCYTIPNQPGIERVVVSGESTQFRFTGNHVAWPVYSAQGVYTKARLDEVKPQCERPLVVQIEDGPAAAVAEARLVDYARMKLGPVKGLPHALQAVLASDVAARTPLTTPWRVLMVGRTPGELLERNYLILNLNDPCAIEDTSWIKPGKVIREVTLTTAGGKACVDFAVKMGLQYVEYDAGWYGHEYDDASDATRVSVDPKRSPLKNALDLQEVIRYGDQRGIGIILYVNRRALERQLDEVLPLYRKWGVKGVKYGFVQVGSQQSTAWLHEAVRKAAAHRLMVDVHDEYRPTGYERTYPNFMTAEGVRGNEEMPPAELNLVLPFTRLLCGPADCTVCWYCDRVKNTRAHQLATSVVFYSPWQFLYWYDRPQQCQGDPELEFFKHVPATWDESRVVQGEIGRTITVARRKGRAWYVGSLNAVERRKVEIPLAFLDAGVQYEASIYSDDAPQGGAPTRVAIERKTVDSTGALAADMAANGGQAVRLIPAGAAK
jgi:alpha-glucosidase